MTASLYQEVILDHYKNPRSPGLRAPYDAEVHQVNPTCGDEITLRLSLDGDRVTDVSYESAGCSISQASASVMAELVTGASVESASASFAAFRRMLRREEDPDEDLLGDGIAFQGVSSYPARVRCALLGWSAWEKALKEASSNDRS